MIDSLRYLTSTRFDIVYGLSLLNRFMKIPKKSHEAKRIPRYVKGTLSDGFLCKRLEEVKLIGYTDSDLAGDVERRRNTSGILCLLGTGAFLDPQRKQIVGLSSVAAEYVAAIRNAIQSH